MTVKRPDVSIYLIARDAAKALDFYVAGLGAVEIARWMDPENGKIGHAEFRIGAQHLFLADEYPSMDALAREESGSTWRDVATIHAHSHEQEEVWHVVEGELEVTIAGKTERAGPGFVAIVPPNREHEV